MKKLFLILVLAAIYAIPASSGTVSTFDFDSAEITIISNADEIAIAQKENEKDKKKKAVKKTSSCCSEKAAVKTGCSEAQKKSCAASKVSCSETKNKKEDKK